MFHHTKHRIYLPIMLFCSFLYLVTLVAPVLTQDIDGRRLGHLVWSKDGQRIAGYYRHGVVLWDGTTGEYIKTIPLVLTEFPFENYGVSVIAMDWHPDNRRLAITGTPEGEPIGFIMILDIETETILDTYVYSDGEIMGIPSLSWSHNGNLLAFTLYDGGIFATEEDDALVILNEDGSLYLEVKNSRTYRASQVVFSPDDQYIATSGHPDNIARVWDTDTGAWLFDLPGNSETRTHIDWNPNGHYIATTDLTQVLIWSALSGELISDISVESGNEQTWASDVKWNYNGSLLAIHQGNNYISIRDTNWEEVDLIDSSGTFDWSPVDNRVVVNTNGDVPIIIHTISEIP